MGKYVTRCGKGVGELAVMEVTQMVGVRTRARALALAAAAAAAGAGAAGRKRRKSAAGPPDQVQTSGYLQLRSRRLVMTSRPPRNSAAGETQAPRVEAASRCSSNASSEVAEVEGLERSMCNSDSRQASREMTPLSEARGEEGDLESTAGAASCPRMAKATPTETEIEEFFTAAEREQAQRFASRYNYDVINDVPLDGRFGWVRINL